MPLAVALRQEGKRAGKAQVHYNQGAMNQQFNPDIHTGECGDNNVSGEFACSVMEPHVATGRDSLLATVPKVVTSSAAPLLGWPQVRSLGDYSLLQHGDDLGPEARVDDVRQRVMSLANSLRSAYTNSLYRVVMGPDNFYGGSNSVAANQSIALIQAYRLTEDRTYLEAALANLDWGAPCRCCSTRCGARDPTRSSSRSERCRVASTSSGCRPALTPTRAASS